MQLLYRCLRNRKLRALLMNEFERVPIAAYFLFVTVLQERFAEDDGSDAGLIHRDAFDPVG